MSTVTKLESRTINEFIIRAGARLEAQNRTICTAIIIMHRLYDRSIMETACNYTLAAAALMLATKYEEDNTIGIRDIVNATYRILHLDKDRMSVGSLQWNIRQGIARLEFVLLRELNFHLEFEHPFKVLAVFLDQLRSWMPDQFENQQIAQTATAICRDIYIVPDIVLNTSAESLAIACINITLQLKQLDVPFCRDWYEVLHKTMTSGKLQRLENKIMSEVYKKNV